MVRFFFIYAYIHTNHRHYHHHLRVHELLKSNGRLDHSQRMQLLQYNDSYLTACMFGYVKIRKMAEEERRENEEFVRRVEAQIRFAE